jgi:hypothetical protein
VGGKTDGEALVYRSAAGQKADVALDCRDVRSRAKWTVTASNRFAKSISYIARESAGWAVRITTEVVVVLLSTLAAVACTTAPNGQMPKGMKIIPLNYLLVLSGGYFEQLSKETGRRYHIYIRLPESCSNALADTHYPVVYLLDGDSLFPILATELAEALAPISSDRSVVRHFPMAMRAVRSM